MTQIEVVLGLGFGDEGKGTIVDWLARRGAPPLVIRYNGGPQAAHHVVTDDGRVHCFAQLGAASFVPGARTHLADDMAVDLYALAGERAELGVPADVTIDPRCVLVTPWHAIVNRLREVALQHGSTGRGVREAKLGPHKLYARELREGFGGAVAVVRAALLGEARKLLDEARASGSAQLDELEQLVEIGHDFELVQEFTAAAREPITLAAEPPRAEHVILESAQGALLDRDHGFFPHVTPSRITRRAAEAAARALGLAGDLAVWGVLRAYHTRHGAGPFPSEDAALAAQLPEAHNRDDWHAGRFRVGWFDAVLARHALAFAGPIDHLALTCVDRVAALPQQGLVDAWDREDFSTAGAFAARAHVEPVASLAAAIPALLGRRVDLESHGPRAADKRLS